MPGPTLIRAPPPDPTKSVIENVLELTPLTSVAPVSDQYSCILSDADCLLQDIFTNTR